jgi:polyhydroxybutyrate depolymerase
MSARRLVALALVALACSSTESERRPTSNRFTTPGDHVLEIAVPGAKRTAILHLPPKFAERGPLPVLLAFHGGGGNAQGFQKYAGLDAHADAQGVVVIYPNGSGRYERRFLTWNAGDCCGHAKEKNVGDVAFVLALLADLANDLDLDPTRVWATGHSNGAMMAYRLAADASKRIAAIVPVAGADMTKSFAPAEPVALLHVHSVDDPRAHYAGGETPGLPFTGGRVTHRPVEAGLARWRERDGCRGEGKASDERSVDGHTATRIDFGPCDDDVDVALWKLTGAGHAWPGATSRLPVKMVGPPTHVLAAGDEVFRFVVRFRKDDAPSLLAAR